MSAGLCSSMHRTVVHVDLVDHRRRRGDQVQVEFPLQPLLDDLQVKQPQEAAAEAEAQGRRCLRLEMEAGVVEGQLAQAVAQMLESGGVGREQAAEHHRDGRLEAGQQLVGRAPVVGDGVADLGFGDVLDAGGDEAHLAGVQHAGQQGLRREDADAVDLARGAADHHPHLHADLELAIDHAHQDDDAQVGIVPAIDQQRLGGGVGIALGGGQPLHDGFQHVVDAEAGLGRDHDGVLGVQADHVLDLLLDPVGFRRRQVDLVEDGDDLVVVVQRLIDVGERLRLDALAGVHHQDRALARRQRPADLVREIDVAGSVHQVELILLAILGGVEQPDGLRLDGDTALPLDIHAVEHLLAHLARVQSPAELDHAVGQCGLAVIDVRDDGEVTDILELGHA